MPLIFNHLIKVIQLRTVELPNLFKLFLNVNMLQSRQIAMQVLRNAFSSRFELRIPFDPIVILREGKPVHHQVILHLLHFAPVQYYLIIAMQTFKEISYQNYIELRFNQKNLEETEQQEALIKYKRNAQLLAEIFSFERKPKTSFKAAPVISTQHLQELEREVEKQKKEGELRCKEIEEKSKSYCELFKKIKQVKTEEDRKAIIEELKAADLYDDRHPYFALGSPFYLNSTDEQVLEVSQQYQIPHESNFSLMQIK